MRRCIDRAAGAILQRRPRHLAESRAVLLERLLDRDQVVVGEQSRFAHAAVSDVQGLAVAGDFLGRDGAGVVRAVAFAEQLVMGGDDVLDGGTVLGLLQAQGVDQDGLVGHRRRDAFQLGELTAGGGEPLQDVRPVESSRVEPGQGANLGHCLYRSAVTCIENWAFLYTFHGHVKASSPHATASGAGTGGAEAASMASNAPRTFASKSASIRKTSANSANAQRPWVPRWFTPGTQ